MGFDRAHPYFLTIWSVVIMRHVLRSMVKSEAKNDMAAKFFRTSNGGSGLYGNEELAW
jgi:hypothetical protein